VLLEDVLVVGDMADTGNAKKPERSVKRRKIDRICDGFDCDNFVIFKPRVSGLFYLRLQKRTWNLLILLDFSGRIKQN
jgi:hypothetical protein